MREVPIGFKLLPITFWASFIAYEHAIYATWGLYLGDLENHTTVFAPEKIYITYTLMKASSILFKHLPYAVCILCVALVLKKHIEFEVHVLYVRQYIPVPALVI
jgi:hypothetical protein